ncbi:unnamed protein product [Prorocentrum cordatum]|uniref:Capsid protein n=1 Tax=Prorocentrum cordatum TaxID=2364126 RepID=A0ABN9Y0M6_9DINO|nr:unnamed protein product [Polarella glacialis]
MCIDWQWYEGASTGISRPLATGTWYAWPLTDVGHWLPVLRQADSVNTASKTYAMRMQLNCRLDAGNVTQRTFLNAFLVSPRKDHTGVIKPIGPNGAIPQLTAIDDDIDNDLFPGASVRLNSAKFKVHAVKYATLTPNSLTAPVANLRDVSYPFATYRKWQWNVPIKLSVRQVDGNSWRTAQFDQFAYYQKYFLLVYSTSLANDTEPNIHVDALTTCINFG